MKPELQIKKGIITMLVLVFILTSGIFAKNGIKDEENFRSKKESSILKLLKTEPVFANYFKNAKNPNLAELFKSVVNEPQMDSVVSAAYDTSFQKQKTTYEYDANGYMNSFTRQYFKNGSIIYGQSLSFEFRSDGQLKSLLSLTLENGLWINSYRDTYSYDPNGNQISYVSEDWDTSSSSWVYDGKEDYVYNTNNKMIVKIESQWNSSSNAWENDRKYEWAYDSNNNKLWEVYFRWHSGAWENSHKYEWTYDGNNKTSEVYTYWGSGVWKNSSKEEYTYDGNNNLISENTFKWNSSSNAWVNEYWTLYTYNSDNKITFENKKNWDSGTSSWKNKERTTYTYSGSGKLLHQLEETFNSGSWEKDNEYIYAYNGNDHLVSYIENDKDKYTYRYNSLGNCNGGSHESWLTNHWVSTDAPGYMFLPWLFTLDNNAEYSVLMELKWYSSLFPGYEFSVYYKGITDVKEKKTTPQTFELKQNYPNPFNPSTKISYTLPQSSNVTLKVYDILGNEISTLVNNKQSAGTYELNFDASNLTSGIYFYQIQAGEFTQVHKMLLLK